MSIGPAPPHSPQLPLSYPGPLRNASRYEKMRLAIKSHLTSTLSREITSYVRLIKSRSEGIEGTKLQEERLKTALVEYLKKLLNDDAGQQEILDFSVKVQKTIGKVGKPLSKEHLPTILALLLGQADPNQAKGLALLLPLTPGGQLTLYLNHPEDAEIYQKIFSWFPKLWASHLEVSFDQLEGVFQTQEEYQNFLEGWFRRELERHPQKGDNLVALLSRVTLDAPTLQTQRSLLVEWVEILIPKIVERILDTLPSQTLTHIVDHSATAIKAHLDSVRETEAEVDKLKDQIQWLKKALLNDAIYPSVPVRHFSKNVWGDDLFTLPLDQRAKFFDSQLCKDRQAHYLEEARYRLLGLEPLIDQELDEMRQALFASSSLSSSQLEKLDRQARSLWGVDFKEVMQDEDVEKRYLIMSVAYQKALQKQVATGVAQVFGTYVSSLITFDFIKEVIHEVSQQPKSGWTKIEEAFPPAQQLRRQLEEGKVQSEDLFNFLPFLKEGLPVLIKGALQLAIEKNMTPHLLRLKGIDQMIDETLLPTAIDAIHGVILSNIIQEHRHTLIEALIDQTQVAALVMLVGGDYQTLVQEEGLSVPAGVDVDEVVKKAVENLRKKMEDLFDQGFDQETLRLGIVEFLKEASTKASGQSDTVYPELIWTVFRDFVGLPPSLKRLAESLPGYPFVASQISKSVTASLAPYREGHGQLVRDLTRLFIDIAKPKKGEQTIGPPLSPLRPVEELVAEVSKVTIALLKQQLGARKGLSSYLFNILPIQTIVTTVFNRGLKSLRHPVITDPLYHHRAVYLMMGGQG